MCIQCSSSSATIIIVHEKKHDYTTELRNNVLHCYHSRTTTHTDAMIIDNLT